MPFLSSLDIRGTPAASKPKANVALILAGGSLGIHMDRIPTSVFCILFNLIVELDGKEVTERQRSFMAGMQRNKSGKIIVFTWPSFYSYYSRPSRNSIKKPGVKRFISIRRPNKPAQLLLNHYLLLFLIWVDVSSLELLYFFNGIAKRNVHNLLNE